MSFKSTWKISYLVFHAENFLFHIFFGHELMLLWIERPAEEERKPDMLKQRNRKNETLKIFNFTYRSLREKMLFVGGTAAFNWHLKSYTGAEKRPDREGNFLINFFASRLHAEGGTFLIFIIDKVFCSPFVYKRPFFIFSRKLFAPFHFISTLSRKEKMIF